MPEQDDLRALEKASSAQGLSGAVIKKWVRQVLWELLEDFLRMMADDELSPRFVSETRADSQLGLRQCNDPTLEVGSSFTNEHRMNRGPAANYKVTERSAASHERSADVDAWNVAQAVPQVSGTDGLKESNSADDDERARTLLIKIHTVSATARATYTALFYLQQLGDREAFGGKTVTLASLPGENQETKRDRIWWLKLEGAVDSQSRKRLEKVSLTPLGKRAWEMYSAFVSVGPTSPER